MQDFVEDVDRVVDASQVEFLGFGSANFDRQIRSAADFRHQEYDDRQKMCLKAWLLVRVLPSALVVGPGDALRKDMVGLVIGMRRKLVCMENDLGLGKRGNKTADRSAVASESGTVRAEDRADVETVGVNESLLEETAGHSETDSLQVGGRREFQVREFFYIE